MSGLIVTCWTLANIRMTTSPPRWIIPKTGGFSVASVPRPRLPLSLVRRPCRPFLRPLHSRFAHFLDQFQTLPNNSVIFGALTQPDDHATAHGWVHGAEQAKSKRTINFQKLC